MKLGFPLRNRKSFKVCKEIPSASSEHLLVRKSLHGSFRHDAEDKEAYYEMLQEICSIFRCFHVCQA